MGLGLKTGRGTAGLAIGLEASGFAGCDGSSELAATVVLITTLFAGLSEAIGRTTGFSLIFNWYKRLIGLIRKRFRAVKLEG